MNQCALWDDIINAVQEDAKVARAVFLSRHPPFGSRTITSKVFIFPLPIANQDVQVIAHHPIFLEALSLGTGVTITLITRAIIR